MKCPREEVEGVQGSGPLSPGRCFGRCFRRMGSLRPWLPAGRPRFIALRRNCIFYKVKACSCAVSSKSTSIVFPTVFAHLVSFCPILVILPTFPTILSLLYLVPCNTGSLGMTVCVVAAALTGQSSLSLPSPRPLYPQDATRSKSG